MNSEDITESKRFGVSKTLAVKPQQVKLPPAPKGPPIKKPRSKSALVSAIEMLLLSSTPLFKPRVKFEISKEAAQFNFALLKEENFDLGKVINNLSKPSITSFGSEFKSPDLLDHLLGKHPRWKYLKQIISEGSLW